MDFASIRSNLNPIDGTSWHAVIDDDRFQLMDFPISIRIDTRSVPDDSPVPEIATAEFQLADTILKGLSTCIAECERMFQNDPTMGHIRNNRDAVIVNPHIWISREIMAMEGPNRWAMVLEIDVNPDFGWHIEFEGLQALEIWAGD